MKRDRLREMNDYINAHGPVRLTELCKEFNISISTLRRDLDTLAKNQSIVKTYGFVTGTAKQNEDKLMHSRSALYTVEKRKTAQIAAQYIEENDVIFIDSGSTSSLIVDYLNPENKLTIITNNLDVVIRGRNFTNVDIYILPGKLNRKNNSFTLTDKSIYSSYNIKKMFMSCTGIDLTYGISHSDISERNAKQCAIKRTPNRFLLVDSAKFGKTAPLYICAIEEFGTICTNERPAKEYLDYCQQHGVRLQYDI